MIQTVNALIKRQIEDTPRLRHHISYGCRIRLQAITSYIYRRETTLHI